MPVVVHPIYPPRTPVYAECCLPNCEEDGLNICHACEKGFCFECDNFFLEHGASYFNNNTAYICFLCYVLLLETRDNSPIR